MSGARIGTAAASVWLVFWLAFMSVYIHFGGLAFAGLSILLGAVGWPIWLLNRKRWPILRLDTALPMAAFALFFAWLAVSGNWSDQGPDTALRLGAQMAVAAAIPALLLTRSETVSIILARILMVTALAGCAVLAVDVATGYGINLLLSPLEAGGDLKKRLADAEMNIGRAHVAWALMTPLLLAMFATRLRKGVAIAASISLLALIVVGTLLNGLAIVPIILLIGLPVMWLGYRNSEAGLKFSVGLFASSILFAPLIGVAARLSGEGLLARLPMSWDHRVRMWDYCLIRLTEAPLLGKGLDSSRTMQDEFTTRIGVDWPIVSLHPHNIGLQTWMEAGLVGAVLLTVAIATLFRPLQALAGREPWRAAALSGTMAATAVAGAVTLGAWQYWWWGLVVVIIALAALVQKSGRSPS